jgi:hypothetical protein
VKLPNADGVNIPDQKLRGYLLDEEHPVGGAKARFFNTLGFSSEDVQVLREALLDVARSGEAREVESSHGVKYIVEGDIRSKHGDRLARIRTVWLLEPGRAVPRFVTAYPA